jgi:hypothetical protein
MEFATFPKNLAYNIKTLAGFSKTCVKLTPDRTAVKNGESFRCKLPSNTLIDLRTLCLYAKGTAERTSGNPVHFPRNTSSLIKTLSVYVNGTLIERIDNYNILYNKIYDLECGVDQVSKRYLEIADPSVAFSVATDQTNATPIINTLASTSSDTNRKLCVSNWLGFISSANCSCVDSNDFGVMEIECELANETILWAGAHTTAGSAVNTIGASWKLDDVHFTISKIVFNDPLYYNMKASKLLSSGLQIAYQTYVASKGSVVTKSSVSVNATINTTSLDQLICCYGPAVPSIQPLRLFGANNANDSLNFAQVLSGYNGLTDNITTASAGAGSGAGTPAKLQRIGGQTGANTNEHDNTAGDAFNQSFFFKSDATGLGTSSIEINNTPLAPQPLEDYEVFNETLIALGNNNLDMSVGVHQGMRSLSDFLKYYFAHIVSLENISKNDDFYKSGLDGKSSALNIVWKQSYPTTGGNVVPYIFAKCTRIMQVNEGNQITIIV